MRLELDRRRKAGSSADAKFSPVSFYLGYQARSSMPSNFDCDLASTLGHTAAALVAARASGYLASAHCLTGKPSSWRVCGVPIPSLMSAESRAGVSIAAIRSTQVDLMGSSFRRFASHRAADLASDRYVNPGPLQFAGALAGGTSLRLSEEHAERGAKLRELREICRQVEASCWPGCSAGVLSTALASLQALRANLEILAEIDSGETTTPLASTLSRREVHASNL